MAIARRLGWLLSLALATAHNRRRKGGTAAFESLPAQRPHTVARPLRRANGETDPTVARHARAVEVPMLMAVAFPILPGKTAEWHTWMEELNGSRREEFVGLLRSVRGG